MQASPLIRSFSESSSAILVGVYTLLSVDGVTVCDVRDSLLPRTLWDNVVYMVTHFHLDDTCIIERIKFIFLFLAFLKMFPLSLIPPNQFCWEMLLGTGVTISTVSLIAKAVIRCIRGGRGPCTRSWWRAGEESRRNPLLLNVSKTKKMVVDFRRKNKTVTRPWRKRWKHWIATDIWVFA